MRTKEALKDRKKKGKIGVSQEGNDIEKSRKKVAPP